MILKYQEQKGLVSLLCPACYHRPLAMQEALQSALANNFFFPVSFTFIARQFWNLIPAANGEKCFHSNKLMASLIIFFNNMICKFEVFFSPFVFPTPSLLCGVSICFLRLSRPSSKAWFTISLTINQVIFFKYE